MKKILLLLILTGCFNTGMGQAVTDESRMFLHPFREVFVNFPSGQLGSGVRLTVLLPEEKIPLSKNYPLAVLLGAERAEVEAAEQIARQNGLLVALVSWEQWAGPQRNDPKLLTCFLQRELLPHLLTNYPVSTVLRGYTIAGRGEAAAQAIAELLNTALPVENIGLVEPGNVEIPAVASAQKVRFYVVGSQAELAHTQPQLERAKLVYGPGFVMQYRRPEQPLVEALDFNYLLARADQLTVKKVDAFTQKEVLAAAGGEQTGFRVAVQLKNGYWFFYVPQTLRLSPPYLVWDPNQGMLRVIAGAQSGSVKIRSAVDKPAFSAKIKLKNL